METFLQVSGFSEQEGQLLPGMVNLINNSVNMDKAQNYLEDKPPVISV